MLSKNLIKLIMCFCICAGSVTPALSSKKLLLSLSSESYQFSSSSEDEARQSISHNIIDHEDDNIAPEDVIESEERSSLGYIPPTRYPNDITKYMLRFVQKYSIKILKSDQPDQKPKKASKKAIARLKSRVKNGYITVKFFEKIHKKTNKFLRNKKEFYSPGWLKTFIEDAMGHAISENYRNKLKNKKVKFKKYIAEDQITIRNFHDWKLPTGEFGNLQSVLFPRSS